MAAKKQAALAAKPTFEVDKAGMAKVFARKGKAFIITELVQNAWDEDTTSVHVTLEDREDGTVRIIVEDDNPEGFKDLAHAYTLFAESAKKGDARKRGRFNLGEKLVIAVCDHASIQTTKGTVVFTDKGRFHTDEKRDNGSVFTGVIAMTAADMKEVQAAVYTLIPPHGIETTFNFKTIPARTPLFTFEASLRTELADEDGRLKPTTRKATVEIYEPLPGEQPSIYEMGIPVVETEDRWHVNVMQKVPLNTDRDNVPPAYLRDIRVHVLNHGHTFLTSDDAKAGWVSNAMEDEKITPDAAKSAFTGKFGEKAVIFDPNDTEANKIAAEQGYTVVPGGSLPKAAWQQVKGAGVVQPAGKVTPSPNPNEGAENLNLMDPAHYPSYIANIAAFAEQLAMRILDVEDIEVRIANAPKWPFAATYGPRRSRKSGCLTLNVGRLGHKWFEQIDESVIDLLIHEFGHHACIDHLDRRYLEALSRYGAKTWRLALTDPAFFAEYGVQTAVAA